jgi:hypothetical protein
MSIGRHSSVAAVLLAAAALGDIAAPARDAGPTISELPRSARGNGSRGHPNNKPAFNRAHLKRRRKIALTSKRRNRR